MLVLRKIHHLKLKQVFFPCTGVIMTFSLLVIYGTSETRAVSFDAVLCTLNGSSLNHILFHLK